jgi:inosose dehydratase
MKIANAPCSWGVLEFESMAAAPSADQVLDEIAATGYSGTELGDWGFMPTDARQLAAALDARHLALVGAFVDVALTDPAAHDSGEAAAVRTARLLADAIRLQAQTANVRLTASARATTVRRSVPRRRQPGPTDSWPMIVLSDATARVPARAAKAGRITTADGPSGAQWDIVADGAERIARAVRDETGLRTAFHHHCATYVETADEIDALMRRTSSDLVGLCLDTGHASFGGADAEALVSRYGGRIWHVHFKDCSQPIAEQARAEEWDYVTAVRHGLFCELGKGQVNFGGVLNRLRASGYDGWIVVEQDVLPSMGTPAASAARNRQFLSGLGL